MTERLKSSMTFRTQAFLLALACVIGIGSLMGGVFNSQRLKTKVSRIDAGPQQSAENLDLRSRRVGLQHHLLRHEL